MSCAWHSGRCAAICSVYITLRPEDPPRAIGFAVEQDGFVSRGLLLHGPLGFAHCKEKIRITSVCIFVCFTRSLLYVGLVYDVGYASSLRARCF